MEPADTLAGVKAFFKMPAETPGPYPYAVKDAVRSMLGDLTRTLGFTTGAEIGCWKGENAEDICRGNPKLHLLCIDAWEGYKGYTDYTLTSHFRKARDEAFARLKPYNVSMMPMWSAEAAKRVDDASLDFLYIDGNHTFEGLCQDLFAWVPKVKRGGIISGHDYCTQPRKFGFRVIEAIDAYTLAHDIAPWFVLGRRKVRPGERSERERSYLWVNP